MMNQLPLLQQPPAYCAYASGECNEDFGSIRLVDGLFLFGSEPQPIASTLERTAKLLGDQSKELWATWRDMDIAGQMVFCEICKTMRGAATIYADVTTLNFNLMFEIGFALGLRIPVRLVRDTNFQRDKRAFDALGVLTTLGYLDFTSADGLAATVREKGPGKPLGEPQERDFRASPMYFLKGPVETDGTIRVRSLLKKARVGFRTYDPVETPRLSLQSARREVFGSFGVVAHLMSSHRDGAPEHNALCALLCGIAVAEEKPVVMLQEEATPQPIDYRDLVQPYETVDQIDRILEAPLLQVVDGLQHRPERANAEAAGLLDRLDLGDVAAENEIVGLKDYFVPTGAFHQVVQGHAQLVVGRKGSGKTALFYGLRESVRRGREVLVLDMKPEGHQFTRLREAVLNELSGGQQEYVIAAFWTYLLSAEVAHKLLNSPAELRDAERDPDRYERYKRLEDAYLSHGLASGDDLSQRLLRQIDRIALRFDAEDEITERTDLAELVYGGDMHTLNDAVAEYLIDEKDAVWLLIDNLDKSWATRGSTPEDILLLRGLLEASAKLRRQLEQRDVTFRAVVFIRTDVYEALNEHSPDRGKDSLVRLEWDDSEVFREILRRRIASSIGEEGTFGELWMRIGPVLVGLQDAFSYMLDRTLLRPRDLLQFVDASVQVAIDRSREKVSADDVLFAERGYSEDMLLSLIYEIDDTRPAMSVAVYAFQSAEQGMTRAQVDARIEAAGIEPEAAAEALELLLWYGFLGVDIGGEQEPMYSFTVRYNVRRLLHAADVAGGLYVVHPAFRGALGIGAAAD
jgi:hypothetical protein